MAGSQIAIRTAASALWAAGEAQSSAAAQLRQAEGRFASGVGSFLELDDAQVTVTEAEGQRAVFNPRYELVPGSHG